MLRFLFYEPEPPFIRISSFEQFLVVQNKLSLLKNLARRVLEASDSSANQWGHLGGQMKN